MTINRLFISPCRALSPAGRGLFAFLILPLATAPAHAATPGGATPILAQWNWWFWLGYFSNVGSRGNVLMLCLVIFCLSLLVLMSATRKS